MLSTVKGLGMSRNGTPTVSPPTFGAHMFLENAFSNAEKDTTTSTRTTTPKTSPKGCWESAHRLVGPRFVPCVPSALNSTHPVELSRKRGPFPRNGGEHATR